MENETWTTRFIISTGNMDHWMYHWQRDVWIYDYKEWERDKMDHYRICDKIPTLEWSLKSSKPLCLFVCFFLLMDFIRFLLLI